MKLLLWRMLVDFSNKAHKDDGGLVLRAGCVHHLERAWECVKTGFGPLN